MTKIEYCDYQLTEQPIWLTQALLLTMIFGTWSGKTTALQGAVATQSLLASVSQNVLSPIILCRNTLNQECILIARTVCVCYR